MKPSLVSDHHSMTTSLLSHVPSTALALMFQKNMKKVHVFLNKADIFTKLVNANVPKPLRNVCTEFDADAL